MEQSPLKIQTHKSISALNPEHTISNSNLVGKRINGLLTILHESNLIKADISDRASMRFKNFSKLTSSVHNDFKEFDIY